jgi:hypothetical protein
MNKEGEPMKRGNASNITYRGLKKSDDTEIESLIRHEFSIGRYVKKEYVVKRATRMYRFGAMAGSTYHEVAEYDGKPVGIIMGRIDRDYRLSKVSSHVLSYLFHPFIIFLTAFGDLKGVLSYVRIVKAYGQLFKRKKGFD